MCEPMTIAATAMAVQTGVGMMQQNMQYDMAAQRAEAQNQMYKKNRENAYQALGRQYGDIGERQSQEQQRAAEEKEQRTREARAQMARARVAAGEAGITGNSVRLGMREISATASRDRSTIDRNLDWTLSQLQRRKRGAKTSTINRINSMQTGQAPSEGAYYDAQAYNLMMAAQLSPEIERQRKEAEAEGVVVNGVRYSGSPDNRASLLEVVQFAREASVTTFPQWKDSDDNFHANHPLADVEQALQAIAPRRSALIAKEGQFIGQAEAGSLTGIEGLDWS